MTAVTMLVQVEIHRNHITLAPLGYGLSFHHIHVTLADKTVMLPITEWTQDEWDVSTTKYHNYIFLVASGPRPSIPSLVTNSRRPQTRGPQLV
jgi:hypothetical protein